MLVKQSSTVSVKVVYKSTFRHRLLSSLNLALFKFLFIVADQPATYPPPQISTLQSSSISTKEASTWPLTLASAKLSSRVNSNAVSKTAETSKTQYRVIKDGSLRLERNQYRISENYITTPITFYQNNITAFFMTDCQVNIASLVMCIL